ncbi:MAG: hypothetical protein WCC12_11230 [Anaerolineales bacterium]
MKKTIFARHENIVLFLLLLVIAALVYLPRVSQIGYVNDDWYLMYSADAYGPGVFADIFSIDRPARALVMRPAYTLFGNNPLYYNLSAYFFRLLSSVCFLWVLQMLWPRQRRAAFLAAVLFLIYPGFLSQPNAIDYQSHIVGLAAALLSIALTVKAVLLESRIYKVLLHILSILLGWLYLGQMEWYLGFEFLRWACVFLLAARSKSTLLQKGMKAIQWAYPSLAIPVFFLVWRLFFFESERGATDIGAQIAQFRELPLATSVWWLVHLLSNSLSAAFFAWAVPFYQLFGYIATLDQLLTAFIFIALFLLLVYWLVRPFDEAEVPEPETRDWRWEALILGIATVAAGLIPVILVNRQADFGDYSRYTLVSSPGSALILISIMFLLSSRAVRWGLLSLLVTVAMFTHHANALRAVNDTESLRAFWWQVAWRIPQLKMDTTLVANYPITTIQEDYFVWGPANLIYYPEGIPDDQIRPGVSAAVLNKYSLLKILSNGGQEHDNRRTIRSVTDYQNILVLSMPTPRSCVQVIDGTRPEISQFEEERLTLIAPHSDINLIDLQSAAHIPPQVVFGPEPAHEWCYYYEKASLARQHDDWDEVLALGNQALKEGYAAGDDIEWIPFLQAYARAGNVESLREIHRLMKNSHPYVVRQVCQSVGGMSDLSQTAKETFDSSFCIE